MKRKINLNRILSLLLVLVLTALTLSHVETIAKRKAVFEALYKKANATMLEQLPATTQKDLESRFEALLAATGLMSDEAFQEKMESLFARGMQLSQDVLLGKRAVSDTQFMKEADALLREFVAIDVELQKDQKILSGEDSFTAFAMSLLWDYLDFYEAHFHEPEALEEGISKTADIFYTADENPLQALDIYQPEETERPLPVILEIHGGGLMYGDKRKVQSYVSKLAKYGYVVVALNYRLAPAVQYDAQVQDILAAYQWVYDHIEEYGGDKDNVFVVGDSAGAQLAYYTCLVGQSETLQKLYAVERSPLQIRALGLISGMFDMKSGPNSVLLPCILGYEYRDLPYFPYLQPEEVLELGTLPPAYFMTEKKDFLRPASLSFAQLLKEKQGEYRLRDDSWLLNRSIGHVTSVVFPEFPESIRATEDMLDYFRKWEKA